MNFLCISLRLPTLQVLPMQGKTGGRNVLYRNGEGHLEVLGFIQTLVLVSLMVGFCSRVEGDEY